LKKQKTTRVIFANLTIGLQLAITVLIFVYGGKWLDDRYITSPLFVAIGAALGMAIGFYHLMKELQRTTEDEKKSEEKEKNKWM